MIGWKTLVMLLPWKHNNIILVFLFTFLILISCDNKGNQKFNDIDNNESFFDQNKKPLPVDFVAFYLKFHSDSLFQIEHIVFPLKGLPDHADPEDVKDEDYYYTSDQWVFQKRSDPNKYSISYILMADIIIEERIVENQYKLMVIRRFAKTSGGWSLIYYAGLNNYKTNSAR
jgi:hypothetical protein